MYRITGYGEMLSDGGRMEAYAQALEQVVKPGHVVLDIGTGPGITALMACRLGARRVYAVEPNDAIWLARDLAKANGLADRIEFIQGLSTEITLPEKADVVVSDLRGILPLYHGSLASIADARTRHLAPGGTLIPKRDTLWVAVVDAPESYERVVGPWRRERFSLDLSAARELAVNSFMRLKDADLRNVAPTTRLGAIDYENVGTRDFLGDARMTVTTKGKPNGLCVWFDSTLVPGVEISNAPDRPALVYGQAFFPWPSPVEVHPGDEIAVSLAASPVTADYEWRWSTVIQRAGAEAVHYRQSEFNGDLLSPASLRKRAAGHVPKLDVDGRIDTLILKLMGEERALGEIAREIAALHPERFPRWQDALTRVADLSTRYSR